MFKILYAMVNDRKEPGFLDDIIFSEGEYEMMLFGVPVIIDVDGEMNEYPAHTGILYKPGQRVHYKAKDGELLYTWIRFDCDEPLFSHDYVPFGEPIFCENYDYFLQYWAMVANENYWHRPSEQFIIDELMHIVFHWLHDYAYPTNSSKYHVLLGKLRSEIYAHPEHDWNLEEMAKNANMSTRFLQKNYKDYAHISLFADVIESRMRWAKMLLIQTDDDINAISEKCGYNNVEHFCRQFKKHEGMSASNYRKEHRGN